MGDSERRKQQMIEEFAKQAREQLDKLKSTSQARIDRYVARGMAKLKEQAKR